MVQNFKSIKPVAHPLAVQVRVPGSKSHTNRALMLATLARGVTTLNHALFSEDTIIFAEVLKILGFRIELDPQADRIIVNGLGGRIPIAEANLFVENAGTAARFLTAFLTLGNGSYTLDGSSRMRERPIGDLVLALNELGAQVSPLASPPGDYLTPPLHVIARGLSGGRTTIRGAVSSQFLSAILMVAPYANKPVEITLEGDLYSKPYIDLTLDVMLDFGLSVQRRAYDRFYISPQCYTSPGHYIIESDVSSASYFFAAPAICGGWIEVSNISRSSRQGDIAFLNILSDMGCQVAERRGATRVIGGEKLVGVDVNMEDISDTSMTLAVIAPFAASPTTIRGIASSRLKETDRVTAICNELARLGVRVEERPDGMTIFPCDGFQPCRILTYNDHRIAMAFSLVGLKVPGIEIENPACVAKTFPGFFDVLDKLR